ncbi:hypothetical protein IFM89_025139 [Coptis chinensis]|uniref:Ankyrin repeat-containing protein n=1 Tax=Coptis chinensis TaxID=261450 RepID=A0A835IXQ1_9MAGN|nr:hypothetical protein IFM89_025139 [Coptis chinensis]
MLVACFICLKNNPLLLYGVALASVQNPLHVAAMAGHLSFVKEMIRLKPEFAAELNQDGFNHIHIASAYGYVEIVRELLKIDFAYCRLTSKDRRTAHKR